MSVFLTQVVVIFGINKSSLVSVLVRVLHVVEIAIVSHLFQVYAVSDADVTTTRKCKINNNACCSRIVNARNQVHENVIMTKTQTKYSPAQKWGKD